MTPRYVVSDAAVRDAWAEFSGPARGAVKAVADQLTVPRHWLSRRLTALGLVAPHRKEPNWSAAEDALVPTLPLHNPKRASTIMAQHGYSRSPTAIVLRARRLNVSRRAAHDTFSANQAAEILGFDPKTVGQYCDAGHITAERMDDERTAQQGGHRWSIRPAALRAFVRDNLGSIDFRRVEKFGFFALIDTGEAPAPARPQRDPVKGWTPEKRKAAYSRFGHLIIQIAEELNVPANELLTYALKGEVPPTGRPAGFDDTRMPSEEPVLALPAPEPRAVPAAKPAKMVAQPKQRFWTDERLAELRRLVEAGQPGKVLLAHFGISRSSLYGVCHRERLSIPRSPREVREAKPTSFWSQERIAELRRLAEVDGLSAAEIAVILGKSRNSVLGATYRHKVRLQERRPAPREKRATPARAPKAKPAPKPERRLLPANSTGSRPVPLRSSPQTQPSNGWVRLQHPDGRWLRMDGLGWVAEKAHSYHVQASKLAAVRARLPLSRECIAVPELPWRPRDIEYARAMHGSV